MFQKMNTKLNERMKKSRREPGFSFFIILIIISVALDILVFVLQNSLYLFIPSGALIVCSLLLVYGLFKYIDRVVGYALPLLVLSFAIGAFGAYSYIELKNNNVLYLLHEKCVFVCWAIYFLVVVFVFCGAAICELRKRKDKSSRIGYVLGLLISYIIILLFFMMFNSHMLNERNNWYENSHMVIKYYCDKDFNPVPFDDKNVVYSVCFDEKDRLVRYNVNKEICYQIEPTYNIDVKENDCFTHAYFSVITFFTVGYGDIYPVSRFAKSIAMFSAVVGHFLSAIFIPLMIIWAQEIQKGSEMRYKKIGNTWWKFISK